MLLTAARLPRRSLSPLVRKVHEQQVEDIMVQLVQQARSSAATYRGRATRPAIRY